MDQQQITAALRAAFQDCALAGAPLDDQQKQILHRWLTSSFSSESSLVVNPLESLSAQERQALVEFVAHCDRNQMDWKTQLLNDWLQGQSSGQVQFIRDRYGMSWLELVQPHHLARYTKDQQVRVKVGDRLQVSNTLWEWIPESEDETQEWYPCTVIRVFESGDQQSTHPGCTVRLENGQEYDVQGMYEWNHGNWRWHLG